MSGHLSSVPVSEPGSGVFPSLIFVQGNDQRSIVLNRTRLPSDVKSIVTLSLPIHACRVSTPSSRQKTGNFMSLIKAVSTEHS